MWEAIYAVLQSSYYLQTVCVSEIHSEFCFAFVSSLESLSWHQDYVYTVFHVQWFCIETVFRETNIAGTLNPGTRLQLYLPTVLSVMSPLWLTTCLFLRLFLQPVVSTDSIQPVKKNSICFEIRFNRRLWLRYYHYHKGLNGVPSSPQRHAGQVLDTLPSMTLNSNKLMDE